jgi:hypothetical protein
MRRIASRKILPVSTILPPVPLLCFLVWRTLSVDFTWFLETTTELPFPAQRSTISREASGFLGRWPHDCRFPLVLARWGGSVAVEILPEYHWLLVQKAGMKRVLLPYRTFSAIVNISSSQEGELPMSRLARPLPARTRRQIVEQVAPRYREASFAQKILLLDAVVEASGSTRKYAITLLNQPTERPPTIQQHPPFDER